ncbi:hypothetical protein [Moorena sp. SIO3I6]|nr:hypothetical protein [Moorena sp. SIO3I6]
MSKKNYTNPCRNCDNFCYLFPTPYSLLPTPYSQIRCSLWYINCKLNRWC